MIPAGYSRSTFYGTLPGGDIFNWSLWANEAPADQAATQAQATAFATEFKVAAAADEIRPDGLCGATTSYGGVRVYSYTGATGKASYIGDAAISVAGTGGASSPLPNQVALVVTLKSAVAGRRSTGRVYLPVTNFLLGAGGQLDNASLIKVATWFSRFVTRLNSHIGSQHIGILSQTAGTFESANTVVVNSRLDIQRRRAGAQPATSKSTVTIT